MQTNLCLELFQLLITFIQTFFFFLNTSIIPIIPYFYLGRPEAEGGGLDIGLLFVHQQQRLVVCQTEVLPCRHVSESERLTPANVTAAPPGDVQSETLARTAT